MKVIKLYSILLFTSLVFIGCNSNKNETNNSMNNLQPTSSKLAANEPQIGDKVANNLVCMVNDAYMGRDQIEVPFEGKMYYGCCAMCEEQIPRDEAVRYAVDPFTSAKVDKAMAYIVLVGKRGEVVYFENATNYQNFLKQLQ